MSDTPESDAAAQRGLTLIGDPPDVLAIPAAVAEICVTASSLERRLTAMTQERDEWRLAAIKGACYRADSPHTTPEEWLKSQTDAALALIAERDKARAMVSVAEAGLLAVKQFCATQSPESSMAVKAIARLDEMEKEAND